MTKLIASAPWFMCETVFNPVCAYAVGLFQMFNVSLCCWLYLC